MTFRLSLLALLIAPVLFADEGMWTYNRLPLNDLKADYDFEPSDELITRLQKGSVRLNNGGSGSFVSPNGLVMTNHGGWDVCRRRFVHDRENVFEMADWMRDGQRAVKVLALHVNH